MSKLAISGVGVVSSTSFLAWLMKMPLAKVGIGVAVVATVVMIGHDLASSPSRLQNWWTQLTQTSPPPTGHATAKFETASKPDPELTAAKALWASVPRFTDARALSDLKKRVMLEHDPDRKFALLQQMGVKVSRAAFDRWLKEATTTQKSYRRDTNELLTNFSGLFNEFVALWAEEDPVSATAWLITQTATASELREVLLSAGKSKQLQLGPWRAMMEGIGDPEERALAELVLKSLEGQDQLLACLGKGVSAAALQDDDFVTSLALNRFGNEVWTPLIDTLARLENKAFLCIALKRVLEDSNKPFRRLALQGLSSSPKFANLFKAMHQ